tara:strand:- start:427 stop:870 length:444 start_codon:yes stop_codon:yes gene_type:complete
MTSLLLPINKYQIQNTIFLEPTRNKIINNSYFIKILYSNSLFTMNGIYLYVPLEITNVQSIHNNKYKYIFNYNQNKSVIQNLINIEETLLNKFNNNKYKRYICKDQLQNEYILTNKNIKTSQFIIKISGIWETETTYGLSFKFINHP